MKTVGKLLKETRFKKKYSLVFLEKKTKIKREFLEAIEKDDWRALPEFPVVWGFTQSLSSFLKLDNKFVGALLKRDYPPKDLAINPKPDVAEKMFWTPKHTFLTGIAVVLVLMAGYLGFQYYRFLRPPFLVVDEPKEGASVGSEEVWVAGKTDPDVTLVINNQPVLLSENGTFQAKIAVFSGTKELTVIAKTRSGKETVIVRKIQAELKQK
jgi:cytoskeletal protein RodZ